MNDNYNIFRNVAKLSKDSVIYKENRNYIKENVLITEIGIIESFNADEQTGIVKIPKYDGLLIDTVVFSTFRLHLEKDDKVLLIQSNTDLFDEEGTNYFDKNNFYILTALKYRKAELVMEEFNIKTKEKIEVSVNEATLKSIFDQIVTVLNGLVVSGGVTVDAKHAFLVPIKSITDMINQVLK